MYDPTIHSKTLARQLRADDFIADKQLLDPVYRAGVISKAVNLGCNGFGPTTLKRSSLRGKDIYGTVDVAEALVLRHITANIRRITGVKQDDRPFIVQCIKTLVSEGVPYRIYKFDVAKFYESVRVPLIMDRLRDDIAFSGQSVRALSSFFACLQAAGINGLPRGLSLSATLAEYLMRGFDRKMTELNRTPGIDERASVGIWYYSRFVDDILIITDGRENIADFRSAALAALPPGLVFNRKSRVLDFMSFSKGNKADLEDEIDFLGYKFDISKAHRNTYNKIERVVNLDLAASKLRRFKSRISKSLWIYHRDKSFVDLRDRIRLLSSNVVYVDPQSGVRRASGLAFNYPLLNPISSKALPGLDQFLRSAIMSPHPKNQLRPTALNSAQRRELAGLTFTRGFVDRRFFHFSGKRLAYLTSAWAHV